MSMDADYCGVNVLVLGDGANELGASPGVLIGPEDLPALARLVHRLLNQPARVRYRMGRFIEIEHARGKGDAFEKKTKAAILKARSLGFRAVVIVRDKDRKALAARLAPLARGRDAAATGQVACAVGLAVETFDAWMICDGKAVGTAGGDGSRSHPDPESLDGQESTGRHAKDRAVELFGSADVLTKRYAQVAACVDLSLLAKCCPQGFAPFATEVRQRIGPVVREQA